MSAIYIKALLALFGVAGVGGVFLLIKKSFTGWIERKRKDDETNEKIEILKDQRDSPVVGVDAADKLWDNYKPPK